MSSPAAQITRRHQHFVGTNKQRSHNQNNTNSSQHHTHHTQNNSNVSGQNHSSTH